MSWRGSREDARRRTLEHFDEAAAAEYEALVGALDARGEDAHASDLARLVTLEPGARVLDAGAGTGTLSRVLTRLDGLELTALEPAPAMVSLLRSKPELSAVALVEGFCDGPDERDLFPPGRFDVIVSRQLVNGLFDPLTAFSNWHRWLAEGGAVVVMDGWYGRDSWRGVWAEEVDVLPLSSIQSMALVPYLLEQAGFEIEAVEPMASVNALPGTRTARFAVVARKRSRA